MKTHSSEFQEPSSPLPVSKKKAAVKIMNSIKSNCARNFFLLAACLGVISTANLQAATNAWNIATGTAAWDLAADWTNNTSFPNAAGDVAFINKTLTGGMTITLGTSVTVGSMTIGNSANNSYTLGANGGNTITLNNSGAGATITINGGANANTIAAPLIIGDSGGLTIGNNGGASRTQVVTGGVTGTGNLTINDTRSGGTSSAMSYTTGAINNTGTLTVNAALTGTTKDDLTISSLIGANVTSFTKIGTATLTISGLNTYTGATTISAGTLTLGLANAIPSTSSVSVASTLNLNGKSDNIDGLSGAGTVDATVAGTITLGIGNNNSGGTFSGVIKNTLGTLSLTKSGSGTEILSGQNTYSGTTTINGGILNAGSTPNPGTSGPFGSSTAVGSILFGGGTLQYSAANQQDYSSRFSTAGNQPIKIGLAGQTITFATSIQGSGTSLSVVDSVGGGSLTLATGESYTGNTAVGTGGVLILNGSASLSSSSTISVGAGGTFDVSALNGSSGTYTVGSSAGFSASGTGTASGSTAATITNDPTGTFSLGSQPVSLTWGGASSGTDSTHPALYVPQGTLQFNNNTITVVVPGTALGAGVYTLISAPSITGTPNSAPAYTGGNGVAFGNTGVISKSGSSVILTVTPSGGTIGTWINDVDGNWSDATKWSSNPNVPHLAGDAATLGVGSALRTVALNANETIGALTFSNANSFVVANNGNTLKLDNSGAGAVVGVSGGTNNAIQTAVGLNDNTVVTVGAGKSLSISGTIANTGAAKTLTFSGTGTNILSGANSYGPAAGTTGTTMNGGGILQLGNNSALAAGDVSVSGNSTLQAGAAGLTIGNNINFGDATTVNNNGNDLTLGGNITGVGALTKIGNHTLTLGGNNTYGGNTTVNGGTLSISAAANLPSPTLVLNGGGLLGNGTFTAINNIGIGLATGAIGTNALIDVASGQTLTLNGIIASAGNGGMDGLTVNSLAPTPGTLILGSANTFNGTTVIAGGTLQLANTLALQNSTLNYNTGTLTFDNSITTATIGSMTGSQNLALQNATPAGVALTIGGNNASMTLGGNLSGLGSLVKAGTGTLVLSNANYAGSTTINGGSGAVTITGGTFGSASSPITVGANLFLTGGTATASTFSLATASGQTGVGATINGAANLTNTTTTIGGSANTAGGLTVNSAGNVNLGDVNVNRDAGAVTVPTAGVGLVINGGNVTATSLNVAQNGVGGRGADLNINGGSLTIADATQSGKFTIHSGNGSGFLTMTNGTLTYLGTDGLFMSVGAGNSVASITGGTNILTGITLNSGSAATTSTFTMGGAANPVLYLGGVGLVINSPSATIFASFGKAVIGALADWSSTAPITLAGGTNSVVFQAADTNGVAHNITLSGVLSGAAGLTKTGNGTLTLSAAETYTGNTTNNAGILVIGSGGSINSTTNITIASGAALDTTGLGAGGLVVGAGQTLAVGHTSGLPTDVNGDLTDSGTLAIAGTGVAGILVENGNLLFNAGSKAIFDLSATTNGANDQVILTGGGSLTCGTINVSINSGPTLATNDYVLFNVTGGGTISGSFNPVPVWAGTVPANASQYFIETVGSTVVLHYFNGTLPTASSATATPSSVVRNQNVTFSVTGTPGTGGSSITSITMDLTFIGGSSSQALTNTSGNTFSGTFLVSPSSSVGVLSLPVIITDNIGTIGATNISLTVNVSTETWSGAAGGGDFNWSTNPNWVSGRAPGYVGDSLIFTGPNNVPVMDQTYSVFALTFDGAASSFNLTSSGPTLTLTGGVTNNSANLQTLSLPMALSGTVLFNAGNAGIAISGNISGSGNLTEVGTGTNTPSGANTFTGGVNINGGVIDLNATETPGTSGPLGVTGKIAFNGGTLYYDPIGADTADYSGRFSTNANQSFKIDTGGNAVTFTSALISSNGSLTKIGNGTLTLSNASSSFSGNVNINGGIVSVMVAAANTPTTTTLGSQSAARTITINSGTTLTMSANNTFGNSPSINIPRIVINGGTMNVTRSTPFGLSNNGGTSGLTLQNGAILFINDTGADGAPFWDGWLGDLVTVNGTSGSSITASANVDSKLDLWSGSSTAAGTGGSTTFNVASTGGAGPDLLVTAPLADSGFGGGTAVKAGLIKTGAGTMQLDAVNTYTGNTVVSNGMLRGIGTIVGQVIVASGNLGAGDVGPAVGTLTINSNLTLQSKVTLRIDKSGGSLQQPDQINVGGNIIYGGTLVVSNITSDATQLAIGDTFQLFNVSGSIAGNFNNIVGSSPGPNLGYLFNPAAGSLTVVTNTAISVVANFSGTPTNGVAPLMVVFTNLSGGATSYVWNFGDGNTLSTGANTNVSNIYTNAGAYTVILTATGPGGVNALTNTAYIVVTNAASPAVAAFNALTITNIFVTQSVSFTNLSTGNITNSAWSFGDGNVANLNGANVTNNVSNQYNTAGTYTVQLIATGAGGASTNTKAGYIVVKAKVALGRPTVAGGNFILGGTNGPAGQTYRILSSTNVALPVINWTPVYTNMFAADGSYTYTNAPLTNKATFFKLVSP